jgi:CheY-like chemotaxis protein
MPHILVVDDEEMIAYSIQKFFEHSGYQVTIAHDPQTALGLCQTITIDGFVTDFRMGRVNGQTLLAQMRQRQPDLPAIFLSAYTADITYPVDHKTQIFSKPIQLSKLVEAMRAMLDDAQAIKI